MKTSNLKYFLVLCLMGCAGAPHKEGLSSYEETIEANSAGDKVFQGLYQNFEFRLTLMSKSIITSIIDRKAQLYQWDEATRNEKLQSMLSKNEGKTPMFMSFFTANRNDNNLDSKKSIWMVYLDTQGKRFAGKVTRNNDHASELKSLFSYHNRWSTAYEVVFDTPVETFVKEGSKITITGPLGKREVLFE